MSIEQLLDAAYVKRFHTVRESQETQTIGEHSYGVTLIICKLHPNPTVNLLKAAVYHDLAEKEAGDIPGHAKWRFPEYAAAFKDVEDVVNAEYEIEVHLEPEERVWLACADMLELYFYSRYRLFLRGSDPMWQIIMNRVHQWFTSQKDIPVEIAMELTK